MLIGVALVSTHTALANIVCDQRVDPPQFYDGTAAGTVQYTDGTGGLLLNYVAQRMTPTNAQNFAIALSADGHLGINFEGSCVTPNGTLHYNGIRGEKQGLELTCPHVCKSIMSALGHHGSCTLRNYGFEISCTDASAAALNSAIQPSPGVAIITIAVATSLMAAISMIVALAWCRDRSRKHTAPIYDNETGNEALLNRVN
jgi:hypothetical protein